MDKERSISVDSLGPHRNNTNTSLNVSSIEENKAEDNKLRIKTNNTSEEHSKILRIRKTQS